MPVVLDIKEQRMTEEVLLQQVEGLRSSTYWIEHKKRLADFDTIYGGTLTGLTPEENTLADRPYIENKLKNATHDIKRLSREARGMPVFAKEGEDTNSALRAKIRAVITDTIWQEGGGASFEGGLYLDLIAGGFAAVSVFENSECDYPQHLRLDPRMAYPTVANGKLRDMLYVEKMKERVAADLFPDLGLSRDPRTKRDVEVVMYFGKNQVLQAVVQGVNGGTKKADITTTWDHNLGVVPVAFRALETADGQFRGLLDQLIGPMLGRNRAVRLMLDYLEDMTHAPYEEKGVKNADVLPGPTTVYHHDETAEFETFMRRVQPAAPASAVFGLLNYLDAQEQSEGFQPPARIGTVRQSIASGSFVESTQGSLSSVVLELQDYVAGLRHDANKIGLMVDEKFLDHKKPLVRSVGQKVDYLPSVDIAGWYYHKVLFGAAAGIDRREADNRILTHLGAGLIDEDIAREQIDYIQNDSNLQDDVDRSILRKAMFSKLISDPNVPFSALAAIEQAMGKGKTRYDAIKEVLPQILEREQLVQQQAQGQAPGAGELPGATPPTGGAGNMSPENQEAALAQGQGAGLEEFQPPMTLQAFAGTGR